LGGESKGKEPRRVLCIHPPPKPKEKGLTNHHKKNAKKRLRKSPKRENGRDTIKP
jgi:hypothetical protein